MKTLNHYADCGLGRIFLHALCAFQRPVTFAWHWRGILRELHPGRFAICYRAITSVLLLAVTVVPTTSVLAQGTYLSAPDGNPTNAVVVAPGGNVGFGTASPLEKLQIAGGKAVIEGINRGAIDPALFGLAPSTGTFYDMMTQRRAGLAGFGVVQTTGVDSPVIWMYDNPDNAFHVKNLPPTASRNPATEGQSLFMVRSDGNVGIGTVDPRTRLDVWGPISTQKELRLYGSWEHFSSIYNHPETGSLIIDPIQDNPLIINANVGIGTGPGDPLVKLDVVGDARISGNLSVVSTGNEVLALSGAATATLIRFNTLSSDNFVLGTITSLGGFGLKNTSDDRYDFFVDGSGNAGIGTTTPQAKLDVNGKINCTVLELTSDRAQKSGFAPVDRLAILDQVARLPLTTWHYTNDPAVRHLGPMAQDFQAAFHVGSDDKHIATVDADGVLFASVQALHEELQEAKAQLEAKDARIAALEQKLARVDTISARLATVERVIAQTASARSTAARVKTVNSQLLAPSDKTR